jgi:hypothetical protein
VHGYSSCDLGLLQLVIVVAVIVYGSSNAKMKLNLMLEPNFNKGGDATPVVVVWKGRSLWTGCRAYVVIVWRGRRPRDLARNHKTSDDSLEGHDKLKTTGCR